jgi:hypothetical protein
MYIDLAVATTWFLQYAGARWRRSTDWIDLLGRLVSVLWILIGLVFTVREYLGLV